MNFVGRQVLRLKTRKALQANSAMETKGQHRFCCSSTQALEEMNITELQTDPWSNNPPEAMDLLVCKAENQLPIKNVEAGRLVQHVSDCSQIMQDFGTTDKPLLASAVSGAGGLGRRFMASVCKRYVQLQLLHITWSQWHQS